MAEKNQKNKPKKCIMTFGIEDDLKCRLEGVASETGASKSELGRRAVKEFLEGGCNDGQIILNITLLTQHIQDLKGSIAEKDYQLIQQYINNIMRLKGGNGYGSF